MKSQSIARAAWIAVLVPFLTALAGWEGLQGAVPIQDGIGPVPPLPAEVLINHPAPEPPSAHAGLAPGHNMMAPLDPANLQAASEVDGGSQVGLFDNLSVFLGLDGSKGPEDLGVNANMGGRFHANWGIPVLESIGLGVQAGTAVNYHENAVRVFKGLIGSTDRTQIFTTLGVFERTAFGLNWGFAYDYLYEDYYNIVHLGQWRGQVGYQIGANDELGFWGALHSKGDNATAFQPFGLDLHLQPINQGNLYWQHTWQTEATTRFWAGLAEKHDRFVLVLPPEPAVHHPFIFGADLYFPLNNWLAVFGEAEFITPNDTGTVTAYLGIAFYPGGGALTAARNRFRPMLPVAGNPNFAVDAVDR